MVVQSPWIWRYLNSFHFHGVIYFIYKHYNSNYLLVCQLINLNTLQYQAYSSRYSGHTKYLRLNFIFDECPALQQEVLLVLAQVTQHSMFWLCIPSHNLWNQCYQTIQNGINTNMCVRYGDRLGSLMPPSWITQVEKSSDATAGKLGGEITSARASLSKPRIRDAHFKFGEFHHARGDLLNALKQFMLARDHSSDASEVRIYAMYLFFVPTTFITMCLIDGRISHQGYCSIRGFE